MEEFIEQLLRDKGVPDGMDEKVKSQLVRDLTDRVVNLINKRLVDSLSEKDLADFEELIDKNPKDTVAVQKFIEEHVPNKEAITGAALVEFRALYLGTKA